MPVWFPDRLGERRLLITSHNIIGCTLEWEYIVIGCTSDSCDWLFYALALAVSESFFPVFRSSTAAMESFYQEIKYFLQNRLYHTLTNTSQ